MPGTLVLTYYKLPDMQDEIIGGKIWGKTPYYEAFGYVCRALRGVALIALPKTLKSALSLK